jgi:hypothetical protein
MITLIRRILKEEVDSKEKSISDIKTDYKIYKIPTSNNCYRSAQIPANSLESVIKEYGIKNIIRMNGDGNDGKHNSDDPITTKQKEKEICERNNCKFHYIYSQNGFKCNGGYVKSINEIIPILDGGNTLIHCAHGADRTGGMVGAFLKYKDWGTEDEIWDYTTQSKFNGWAKMSAKTFWDGYHKYALGFISLDKLKILKPPPKDFKCE